MFMSVLRTYSKPILNYTDKSCCVLYRASRSSEVNFTKNYTLLYLYLYKWLLLSKAAFHYSSKLQTWLSTCVSVSKARRKQVESMSKACRKQVESQLQTCLKPNNNNKFQRLSVLLQRYNGVLLHDSFGTDCTE